MTNQERREKVIKGLECCIETSEMCWENPACPYDQQMNEGDGCITLMMRDALALLKAQEPVEPKWQKGYAYCGQCGYRLHWIVDRNNFCPNCGKVVKWDA